MRTTTTVQIDPVTREMLRDLKLHPRETWGDVIRRLAEREKAAEQGRSGATAAVGRRSA